MAQSRQLNAPLRRSIQKDIHMRTIGLLAFCGCLWLAPGRCAADNADEEKTGLKVGAKAPAFMLQDQAGKERGLDEFLKQRKVALVFYRSASW
jgi:hypothetical protein